MLQVREREREREVDVPVEAVSVQGSAVTAAGDLQGRPGVVASLGRPQFRQAFSGHLDVFCLKTLSVSWAGITSACRGEPAHFLKVESTSWMANFAVAGRRPPFAGEA